MKVEVDTMDFCDVSCPMLEIEESVLEGFSLKDGKTRNTFRNCKYLNICRNAIDQYEKYLAEIRKES